MLISLLLACGSAGFVLEGPDDFGPVMSVLWTEMEDEVDLYVLGDGGTLDAYGPSVLSPQVTMYGYTRTCADAQAAWERAGEASEDLVDAAEGGSACDAVPDYLEAQEQDWHTEPIAYLMWCLGDTCEESPDAGGYAFGEEVYGSIRYRDDAPTPREDWSEEACTFGGDIAEETEYWQVSDGDVDVDHANIVSGMGGSFGAEIVGPDGEDGNWEGTFDAVPCVLPSIDTIVLW